MPDVSVYSDAQPNASNSISHLVPFPHLQFDGISKSDFIKLQRSDSSIAHIWSWAEQGVKRCFVVEDVLMCLSTTNGRISHSIVLPKQLRQEVLTIAHNHSGHFGVGATRALINPYFTWPGSYRDIKNHVKSCVQCQRFNSSSPSKAPLIPPEIITKRFEKLAVDVVGPLPKSKQNYRFILTAMDLATGFPFACPMHGFTAEETAQNLILIFSFTGSPVAVLSDQGSNFLSRVMSCVYAKFGILRIRTSPYHPESNGKLERLHSTLKAVIRKSLDNRSDWPAVIPLALFYLRNLPHSRHGHTPYELTFLKPTPHILSSLRSIWISPDSSVNVPRFLDELNNSMEAVLLALKQRVKDDVVRKRESRDHRKLRVFGIGSLVMLRIPGLHGSLEASWEGPYKIVARTSEVNYRVIPVGAQNKSKSKVVHVNLLKEFKQGSHVFAVVAVHDDSHVISNSISSSISPELSLDHHSEMSSLLSSYTSVFSDTPGCTQTTSHSISVTCDTPVWTPSYTIPAQVEKAFQTSIEELLALGIIEPSQSRWSSPPIPIIKKDGSIRIVVDYRKLNSVTVPEPFQMPTVTEIVSRLGNAVYLSKLDLMKGFHQVPMEPGSRQYTAFSCRHGKFQYCRMPFGLRNAPATFQLLMQTVLRGLESFSSAYIDDIIIFSLSWHDHLSHINQVLSRLNHHGLTVKQSKCCWAFSSFDFLGYNVGNGSLSIPEARVKQLREYARPKTIPQLRSFLGLVNYYRHFVLNFASHSRHLTCLTKRGLPQNIDWNNDAIDAFDVIVSCICNNISLCVPLLSDSFGVFCDASQSGIGGVLCVYRSNSWKTVAFYSRQLQPRESRYSATEIEALAMLSSIEHFAYYLTGQDFKVFTDHRALTHLFDSPSLNNRLWRWRVRLMDFSFQIVYIQGHLNVLADAMSRQGWTPLPSEDNDTDLASVAGLRSSLGGGVV